MARGSRLAAPLAALALLAVPGCAAIQQLAALRSVTFAFAGVSDVRLAGIPIGEESSFRSLTVADAARLTAAVVAEHVPLQMVAHLDATNPADNKVAARLAGLDWTLFIEDRRMLSGGLGSPISIEPGRTGDVPLTVSLNLFDLESGGARDLYDLGLAVAGRGPVTKDLRLELVPTIDTSLGPIRYPAPVVVRRAASGG